MLIVNVIFSTSVHAHNFWSNNQQNIFVCCSDEELEDSKALLYLPIAPEVEDPEENPFGPPPDASVQAAAPEDTLAGSDKKQRQPSSEGGPAKKKARTTTIELQGVPSDGEKTKSTDGLSMALVCDMEGYGITL